MKPFGVGITMPKKVYSRMLMPLYFFVASPLINFKEDKVTLLGTGDSTQGHFESSDAVLHMPKLRFISHG